MVTHLVAYYGSKIELAKKRITIQNIEKKRDIYEDYLSMIAVFEQNKVIEKNFKVEHDYYILL